MNTEINYKGKKLEDIYALALIGANFITEKSDTGVSVVNSLKKQLYIKTVLLTRLLNVFEIPDDKVMSLEQYNDNNLVVTDFKGKGKVRLVSDYNLFIKMLDDEINNIVVCNNDIENRISYSIKTNFTPEKIEELVKQKEELIKELNKK